MKHLLACLSALLLALPALAQGDEAEHARIGAERSAADARLVEQQKACRAKFAVTGCLEKATREHNAAVSELRRQERVLNDAARKRRAAERQQELDERASPQRQQEAAQRRADAIEEQKKREARAADKAAQRAEDDRKRVQKGPRPPGTASGAPLPQGTPRQPAKGKSNAPTAEEAAANRAAYDLRVQQAQQHQAQVRERIAKRSKPAASALPVPR